MRTTRRILGVGAVVLAGAAATVPLLGSPAAHATGFTGGDLVVYRVGSGSAALTNAAAPVFLDEFSATGSKLQSIALPTTASGSNLPLTAAGESRSEGLVTRSADGRVVTVTGYDAAPGTNGPTVGGVTESLTASSTTSVPRVVGVVDGNGNVDTSTRLTGASAPSIIRSAATTNDDRLLVAGGNGGLLSTAVGGTTATVAAGSADTNLNQVSVQSGTVFTSGILDDRLAKVSGSTVTDVPGLPDNLLTYGYSFVDATGAGWSGTTADTLYLADASNRAGTVDKYHFNGTTWVLAGSYDVPGVSGLVADVDGDSVSLAVTTPTQLLTLTDTDAAGSTFAPSAPTVLATAPTNTEFRGVALAPTQSGPSAFLHTPAAGSTVSIAGATTPVTAYVPADATITSVTATIGTSTATATQGAGGTWTANVPTAGLKAGAANVVLKATSPAGTTTVTRAVTLSGTSAPVIPAGDLAPGHTYAASDAKVHRTGTWTAYATAASPTKKGLSASKKKDALKATVYGKTLVLSFTKGPKNGKVVVTIDGKATTVDLYAKKAATFAKSFALGTTKGHAVTITVAGSKSAKSKGTAVQVAALKVS